MFLFFSFYVVNYPQPPSLGTDGGDNVCDVHENLSASQVEVDSPSAQESSNIIHTHNVDSSDTRQDDSLIIGSVISWQTEPTTFNPQEALLSFSDTSSIETDNYDSISSSDADLQVSN